MSRDGPRDDPLWVDSNFALFVLTSVSVDEINRVLQAAYEGSTIDTYKFWLVDDYANAPRERREGESTVNESGTETPIPEHWKSPFIGKAIQDAAEFLVRAPEDARIDWHHFAVLGDDFLKRRLVTLCRIGDEELKGTSLETLPCKVEFSTLCLSSLEPHKWEELKKDQDGDGEKPIWS